VTVDVLDQEIPDLLLSPRQHSASLVGRRSNMCSQEG
jgi:hypothetical protein